MTALTINQLCDLLLPSLRSYERRFGIPLDFRINYTEGLIEVISPDGAVLVWSATDLDWKKKWNERMRGLVRLSFAKYREAEENAFWRDVAPLRDAA